MLDFISIGSAVMDVYVRSRDFHLTKKNGDVYLCQQFGDKIEIDKFELRLGGGAANTSVCFSRLGFSAGVVAELGVDDWSEIVVKKLGLESVNCRHMIVERGEKTGGSVILIGPGGGRTVMVNRGASGMLEPSDIPVSQLFRAGWVHLSSIAGNLDTLRTIFQAVPAKNLSWNPGKNELILLGEERLSIADINCSIFSVNAREWQMISNLQDQIINLIDEVVITDGDRGGFIFIKGKKKSFSAKSQIVVDETGAGDAFVSTYVAFRRYNLPAEYALEMALHNASSVIGHIGSQTGLLRKETLLNRLEQH